MGAHQNVRHVERGKKILYAAQKICTKSDFIHLLRLYSFLIQPSDIVFVLRLIKFAPLFRVAVSLTRWSFFSFLLPLLQGLLTPGIEFNLIFKFNSKRQAIHYTIILIPPEEKVLTSAGIELGYPRLPVRSTDHSATRPLFSKKNFPLNIKLNN